VAAAVVVVVSVEQEILATQARMVKTAIQVLLDQTELAPRQAVKVVQHHQTGQDSLDSMGCLVMLAQLAMTVSVQIMAAQRQRIGREDLEPMEIPVPMVILALMEIQAPVQPMVIPAVLVNLAHLVKLEIQVIQAILVIRAL
jgi:hypothetical protein